MLLFYFVVCQLKMVIFFLFLLSLYRVFVLCVTQRDVQKGLARATTIFFLMVRFICKITVNCVDKCYRTTLFLKPFLCILCTFLVHTVMEKKKSFSPKFLLIKTLSLLEIQSLPDEFRLVPFYQY